MKNLSSVLLSVFFFGVCVTPALAASSGARSAGTVISDDTSGTTAWFNASNVTTSNNAYAGALLLVNENSKILKATNFNFSIPSEATINGISVSVERQSAVGGDITDNSVQLIQDGSYTGDNKADTLTLWSSGSDEITAYGGVTDTWGVSWTADQINASTFGVGIIAHDTNNTQSFGGDAKIDHITITVHYTEAAVSSSASGGGGNATWLIQLRQQNGLDQWGAPISSSSSSVSSSVTSTEEVIHEAATEPAIEGTMSSSSSSTSVTVTQSKDWHWISDTDPTPADWIISFRLRVCERVGRWFQEKPASVLTSVLPRLNDRLGNRWGFGCVAPTKVR